jgi:hypothetical protein
MPGFMPGIHDLTAAPDSKTWMAGTSPAMTGGAMAPSDYFPFSY